MSPTHPALHIRSRMIVALALLIVAGACADATAPNPVRAPLESGDATVMFGDRDSDEDEYGDDDDDRRKKRPKPEGDCTFARGITTCVTTSETTVVETRVVYGSCVAGPSGEPGRRTTTYEDTYVVTTTTRTYYRGRRGRMIRSETSESRTLQSSREVSRTCEPL